MEVAENQIHVHVITLSTTGFVCTSLWEPYILRRVDQLDTMFFGHFKYAARHFMTSK